MYSTQRTRASAVFRLSVQLVFVATLAHSMPVARAASNEAIEAEHGVVASRSRLASLVGRFILQKESGNAIDAAVAASFALAVTYPSAGNIGGGGFMVIRLADGTIVANDHRERAPAAATRDMFLDASGEIVKGRSTESHLAAGVPGTVAGLLDVLDKYGTLSRKKVMAPAIVLAREGFRLTSDLADDFESEKEAFARHPSSARIFVKKDGSAFKDGDMFVQKDLALTLDRISARGRDGFYDGPVASAIVAEMQRGGGLITLADLKDYRSIWREPVRGTYRGFEIVSMPPPSSGGALLIEMLNMLEPYDLRAMGFGSADAMHVMIEAERRAYADRAQHLGDPDFYPVPLATLIDKSYAKSRFADFDPKHASASVAIAPGQIAEHPNTTHISVMDAKGNAVAYTTTLNLSYGSKIVVDGAGFLLNDEMDDFASKENTPNAFGLVGREANEIAPGKRMLSSMAPTIVLDDQKQPMLVTGSPGGSTIITTVLQIVVNVIDHQMGVADAVAAPRFHHQWLPDRVVYERYGFSPDTVALLRERGHQNVVVLPFDRGIGDANSVMRVGTLLYGMSDPREQGAAVGY